MYASLSCCLRGSGEVPKVDMDAGIRELASRYSYIVDVEFLRNCHRYLQSRLGRRYDHKDASRLREVAGASALSHPLIHP